MTGAGDGKARRAARQDPTEEQIAEARLALENLIRLLARTSARACHELGIEFDMNDPEVARDVMRATLEGLFYSERRTGRKAGGRAKPRAG